MTSVAIKSDAFLLILDNVYMIKFIKESVREFKHVVWPTREETKKYFIIVITFIVLFGLYIMMANGLFSYIVEFLKENI